MIKKIDFVVPSKIYAIILFCIQRTSIESNVNMFTYRECNKVENPKKTQ